MPDAVDDPEKAPELVTDVLGAPYQAETITLEDDAEGAVVATLVSRRAAAPTRRAVLHVHGFADYFFQTGAADYWVEQGYDFYAVDLRKYGRSFRPHQTPNFVTDLAEHFAELDECFRRVTERDGHDHVVLTGHSTGGLILPLWADERQPEIAGMVLNSPWLDLQGSLLLRTAVTKAIDQIGLRRPYLTVPRDVSGFYARSLHHEHDGEWDFDLAWKPLESWPVYTGWLRAVRRGHARVHRGLSVPAPVLVLTSAASSHPKEYDETCASTDIVLDVDLIRKWTHKLGDQVTLTRVHGAIHDVFLSRKDVRETAYAEVSRWASAYLPPPPPTTCSDGSAR